MTNRGVMVAWWLLALVAIALTGRCDGSSNDTSTVTTSLPTYGPTYVVATTSP